MDVPKESIYFWMYSQGLKHVCLKDIEAACALACKEIRDKDYRNYWNGFHNSDLYKGPGKDDIFMLTKRSRPRFSSKDYFNKEYCMYDPHPYAKLKVEVENRWVPCSSTNKPMIKWSNGCMTMADAVAYKDQMYLAENVKGTKMIVIDCDGDHGEGIDYETMAFLHRYAEMTHCIEKPSEFMGISTSFHLTFSVDRIIPTMHFPYAHIDIVGNQRNSLRYWKNKKWNGKPPADMTPIIWNEIRRYIEYRKEKADA